MALTMISGATGSAGTNTILAAQKVIDMSDKIYLLEPNAAPLYVLVSKLSKEASIGSKFSWLEDEHFVLNKFHYMLENPITLIHNVII